MSPCRTKTDKIPKKLKFYGENEKIAKKQNSNKKFVEIYGYCNSDLEINVSIDTVISKSENNGISFEYGSYSNESLLMKSSNTVASKIKIHKNFFQIF